jgi:hypothetical protein
MLPRHTAAAQPAAPDRARSSPGESPSEGKVEPSDPEMARTALVAREPASSPPRAPRVVASAITPLLPVAPELSTSRPASGGPVSSPQADTGDALAGPLLKIGRIEVRPPAPASASIPPMKPVAVTTRAVVVPRAQVRQSLDEYRATRRR